MYNCKVTLKTAMLTLSLLLLSGCATSFDLSEHLELQPDVDYSPGFQKSLPYTQLVNAIHLQNGEMSSEEFARYKSAIYTIHKEAVSYTLDELAIPENVARGVLLDLQNNQDDLARFYITELAKATTSPRSLERDEPALNYPHYLSINQFTDVASQNMSFIMDMFLGFVSHGVASQNSVAAATKPFQILLYKALLPISEELRNQALIIDQVHARFKLKSQVSRMIAEFGTISREYKSSIVVQPSLDLFFFESKAEIWSNSSAIVKAGFNLDKLFRVDIDPERKSLLVTLPEPRLLSIDTRSHFQNVENGWLQKINENNMNEFIQLERDEFTQIALNSGIFTEAKRNAESILKSILAPIVQTPYFNYKIEIDYQEGPYINASLD